MRKLYSDLAADGLSPKTIHNIHTCLHRALQQGVEDEVLGRNVVDQVKPPKVQGQQMQALTVEEVRLVLQAAGTPVPTSGRWKNPPPFATCAGVVGWIGLRGVGCRFALASRLASRCRQARPFTRVFRRAPARTLWEADGRRRTGVRHNARKSGRIIGAEALR